MSTPSQIIAKARRQTYSNSVSYTDSDAILDLNNRLQILYSRVQSEVDEWHHWNYWITDSVVGQSEYTITNLSTLAINQIDGVSVKFNTSDDNYTKLNRIDFNSLEYDMQAYEDWAWSPFYTIKDQSIFIFPAPTVAVTNWIKIFSIQQPADVTTSSSESDIKIAPRFHNAIVYGMIADYWNANGRDDKWNKYDAMFITQWDMMVKFMKNRSQQPMEYVVSINPYA